MVDLALPLCWQPGEFVFVSCMANTDAQIHLCCRKKSQQNHTVDRGKLPHIALSFTQFVFISISVLVFHH